MKSFKLFMTITGASLCGSSIFFAIFNLIQDIDMPSKGFLIAGIACLTLVNSLDLAHINLYREVDEVFQQETNRRIKELRDVVLDARPKEYNVDSARMSQLSDEERKTLEDAERSAISPLLVEDPLPPGTILHQQGETMAQQETMPEWNELIKTVKHAWEYGIHCNDMTLGEIEEDISSALDRFAKANGLPEINWEEEENDA